MWLPKKERDTAQTTTCYTVTAPSSSAYACQDSSRAHPYYNRSAKGRHDQADDVGALCPSALDLRGTNSLDLHRVSSMDGRAEGWLVPGSAPAAPGRSDGSDARIDMWVPSPPRAAVLMERLRMDQREILVPDRIWDGTCRGSVSEEGAGEVKEEV